MYRTKNKQQHDWVGKRNHWEVCRKFVFILNENWYEYQSESVTENDS